MAVCGAGVGKGLAGFRHEVPIVAGGMKCELQNSESIGIARLTVGVKRREGSVRILSASTYDELANTMLRV